MNKHFWNWARDETNPEERTLLLEGPIAEESWYGDEVTPAAFREELFSADGPIVISVNSPGGDTIAASQIYTMLREYPGDGGHQGLYEPHGHDDDPQPLHHRHGRQRGNAQGGSAAG